MNHRPCRTTIVAALCAVGLFTSAAVATGSAAAATDPDAQQVVKIGGVWKSNATYYESVNLLCAQAFHATKDATAVAELWYQIPNGSAAFVAWDIGGDDNRTCTQIPTAFEDRVLDMQSYFRSASGERTQYPIGPFGFGVRI
jgi:hypothetical protein